ncbi:MAG: RES family NAD+ phosphorylase [Pseudomonadota bacterium]
MPGEDKPRRRNLKGDKQFRIIPTRFPPVDIFESLVSADELEILFAIESMTNDRLQAQAGNLSNVPRTQWVTGPGATVVMAAFTHIGNASRFSNGDYGVYYAALDEDTAIAETVFHQQRRLAATREAPIEIDMRVYVGRCDASFEDIRGERWRHLQDPDLGRWPIAQAFGAERRAAGASGLLYKSARRQRGQCIAAFLPKAVSLPRQGRHLRYSWDGEKIAHVFSVGNLRTL